MPVDATMVNMGDDEAFARAVRALVDMLDPEWLSEVYALSELHEVQSRAAGSVDGENFLRALRAHTSAATDAQTSRDRADPQLRLLLGGIALVVDQTRAFEGSERRHRDLRDRVRAWRFEAFFKTLFECEAALHWGRSAGVSGVAFPDGHHPDVWTDVPVAGRVLRYPHECKRLDPSGQPERGTEELADKLEQFVRALWGQIGALKVTVWLHAAADHIDVAALFAHLETLARQSADEGSTAWRTQADADGQYQVSVARAPEYDELASRPIDLTDVPSQPLLRVCSESTYLGTTQDPARLKYAISLRSDVLPRRIGAFERNLVAALNQIAAEAYDVPGIANIRLRPPRDLGDLYEADSIARRVLASSEGQHLALVVLFWNEAEREDGDSLVVGGQHGREVTAFWHLRAHYVTAHRSPIDFTPLDSGATRFPPADGVLMRDPGSGTIVPLPHEVLALLDDPLFVEPLPGSEGNDSATAATLYFKSAVPYKLDVAQIVRVFSVSSRILMAAFTLDATFRVIEFVGREPVRVATVDLRAWLGQTEFIFWLRDADGDWSLKAGHADGITEARARSVRVPRAFLHDANDVAAADA